MGITSGEEGLRTFSGIGMEVIRVAADSLPLDGQREGVECLVDEGWQLGKWRLVGLLWTEVWR